MVRAEASDEGREAADSGAAACLRLAAQLHGVALTARQLRALGPRWAGLDEVLAGIGFRGRLLRCDGEQLPDLVRAAPAIVRLRDGRCVVMAGIDAGGEGVAVTLLDPMTGGRPETHALDRFLPVWSGEALLLSPGKAENDPLPRGLRSLAALAWRDARSCRDLMLATGASALLAAAAIMFARAFADDAVTAETPDTLTAVVLGIGVVVGFDWAFAALRHALATRVAGRLGARFDRIAFERVLRLPVAAFETWPAASLARSLVAAGDLPATVVRPVVGAALDLCVAVPLFLVLLATCPALALVTAAAVTLGVLALVLPARRLAVAATAREASSKATDDDAYETLAGMRAVKDAALEPRVRRRMDNRTAQLARADIAEAEAAGWLDLLASTLAWLVGYGPFALGVVLTLANKVALSRADLFVVLLVCGRLAASLRDLAPFVEALLRGRALLRSLCTVADAATEAEIGRPGLQSPPSGQFAFSDVSYSYPGALLPALDAVSFEVPAGSFLGIVGRSGAGKSTLARLLQRGGGDHDGLIKLDGVDIRQMHLAYLRRCVLVVNDDTPVFPGTVRANLTVGLGAIPEDALASAIRTAGLDDTIQRLPHGLATVLGEADFLLSDGERQRLALARAVLARPAILVLDEATTAIDAVGEAALLANLRRASQNQTLVVIAQRLAAVARADAILVLEEGEVRDIGRHADLAARSSFYSGVWQRQARRVLVGHRHDPLLPSRDIHVA